MEQNDLLENVNIEEIAEEGNKIYESLKNEYEPGENGKFLAIDVESKDVFLAEESVDAVQKAREAHPNKVFYVVRIGFSSAEAMAHALMHSS